MSEADVLARDVNSSIAPGTVMVISTTGIPPAHTPSTAYMACLAEVARITGTMPISTIRSATCFFVIWILDCQSGGSSGSKAPLPGIHYVDLPSSPSSRFDSNPAFRKYLFIGLLKGQRAFRINQQPC